MTQANLTPKLRFPGFVDEWEVKKLGDISVFHDGKRIPLSTGERLKRQGQFPYYGASGIIDYVDDYIFDGEYILLGEDGANILTRSTRLAFIISGKNWVNNHAHVIKAKGSHYFLAEYLERLNYEDYNTGTAQPKLNSAVCKSIPVIIPSEDEQEKIAGFLKVVDERVSLQEKKVELLKKYKKGLTQKIFSQKLRFKNENGQSYPDWQEKRFGDVFYERTETGDNKDRMLSVTINNGVVPFSSISRKDNSNVGKGNYKKVKKGDIAYNSMRMWQGASGVSQYDGIVSPAYTVITVNDKNNSVFWAYYFKLTSMIHIFERHSQGLTSDTWNLKFKALSRIKSRSPYIEEQQKIANFLSSIDDKIKVEETKLAESKKFKKALLQRMFV